MSTQYRCTNSVRRVLVRDTKGANGKPVVNGIDYLEVDPVDQNKLLVHFIHPLPGQPKGVPANPALNEESFVIEGGVRLKDINVVTAEAAGNIVTVTVDAAGDFSTYKLRLVSPALAEGVTPPGFDPQLAEVLFSFKVNCENDFDCQQQQVCPESVLPEPLISYLAKDYASFRRLLLDRLAVTMPDWQERNPADLGVVLAELLAYAGDYLSYYQDAVATEAYLGTARHRVSVRRHARLVDYHMHDGANARAWICFEVAGDLLGTPDQPALRAGSAIVSGPDLSTVFETLHPVVSLRAKRNAIAFYTWGDPDCCLPKSATRAYLTGSAADLDLAKGDVLIFEERLGPESGRPEDADPAHRHAVRLSEEPLDQTDPLTQQSVLEIRWHAEDALPFPLCLREFTDATNQIVASSVAYGNVALADHGRTVSEDEAEGTLVPASVPADRPYRPRLETDRGLTHAMPYDDGAARAGPAAAALRLDLHQVLPSVTVRAEGTLWRPKRDLLNSGRFAPEFVVEMEDDGRATLRFGDDTLGRQPVEGTAFGTSYRIGSGPAGNVGAEALDRLVVPIAGIKKVRNPMPAAGGTAPEPTEQVRLYAPQAFRSQERAVTEADYAAAAERHSDVQRAAATRRWTGSWYTMFITVDRRGGRPVDAGFEEELRRWLERFRLAGYDVEIDGPLYVTLDIVLTACVAPGYFRSNVKKALLDAFSNSDLPDGRRGFFHPDNFTFGQPVYLSQIIATAMQVQGVQWVDAEEALDKPNRFRRLGQDSHGEAAAGEIELGRLEIARLDNDPSVPENGKLDFIMVGGI